MTEKKPDSLDALCINTIRTLSIDTVQKANSGHPGLPLGAAPMAYVLWSQFLKHNPKNPQWYNRDRFILSAGHGSALLYSLLHLTGYDLPLSQLQQFRQWDSITPGHPEYRLTPGVEITTGPLGQGFANGVGMAIAEANLAARYNQPDHKIIDHYTYAIVSDGDLMEGVAAEAASLAGHLKLGKLIYLYDDNHICLSSATHLAYTEERAARFEAHGWHTITVNDGNNIADIHQAIETAKTVTDKPSLILVRTIIGFGSPHKQNTFGAHGSPLGAEEVALTKQQLGFPEDQFFYIPEKAKSHLQEAIASGQKAEDAWKAAFQAYAKAHPKLATELKQMMENTIPKDWAKGIPIYPADEKGLSTRVAGGQVMQAINPVIPGFLGGSADLNPSTFTELLNYGNFQSPDTAEGDQQGAQDGGWNYAGRNIYYGIREHAMGSISNGLATYPGFIPYTATFMTFSDYMRPAIRLAALMRTQVVFVFTHDSIALGEDGPTHQPIEQLAALRAIPRLIVIRPCDANETAEAWKSAIETRDHPTSLILSRQNLPTLDRNVYASAEGLHQGAYVLSDPDHGEPELILMASGSEVALIVAAAKVLTKKGIAVRLVSMPSWELFDAQPQHYKDSVLPPNLQTRLAVETGISQGWERYIGEKGDIIAIDNRFGESAPGNVVLEKYGFTVDNVCERANALCKGEKS